MAISEITGAFATSNNKTAAGTTLTVSPAATIPAGSLIVVTWISDNLSATTPTGSVTDTGSNSYTAHAFRGQNATAGGGLVGGIAAATATTELTTSSTITLTLSGGVTAKAMSVKAYSNAYNTLRNAVVVNSAASTALTVTSGSATSGDLVVGLMAHEANTTAPAADTDTTNGSWDSGDTMGTSGGSAATNISGRTQHKVVTGTATQTLNATITSNDWVALVAIFTPKAEPALNAFRFYADGTESGSTALANQDTIAVTPADSNYNFQLRVRLQNTVAVAGASTDDYQLQYKVNAGSWANVGASGAVTNFNSTNLTDGNATTNRLGAGTGSFVAGEISEDGLVDDLSLTASNYNELLYSLTVNSASVSSGDAIQFRVLYNGGIITYNQVPEISVIKHVNATYVEDFTGGADNTSVTTSNSIFTTVNNGSDGSVKFETDPPQIYTGSAGLIIDRGTVGTTGVRRTISSTSTLNIRGFFYMGASAANNPAAIQFNTTPTVTRNSSGNITFGGSTSTNTYINKMVRLEVTTSNLSNWTLKIFADGNLYSPTATETLTPTSTIPYVSYIDFVTGSASTSTPLKMFGLYISTEAAIPPLVAADTGAISSSESVSTQVSFTSDDPTQLSNTNPVITYYFNGSTSDPNSVWTNDSNISDENFSTYATCSTVGSTSSNFLQVNGTTASASGIGTITQVRVRVYGEGLPSGSAAIYTQGLGELLGTATRGGASGEPGWGSYTTLSTPTGGWTWTKVSLLEAKNYVGSSPGTSSVGKIEVEVTSTVDVDVASIEITGSGPDLVSASDTGTISTTDNTDLLLVTFTATDTSAITGTDAVSSTSVTLSTTDTGAISGSDTGSLGTIATSASDTGTLSLSESVATFVTLSASDSSAIVGTDSSAIMAGVSTTDTGTLSLSESLTVRKGPRVKSSASNNAGTAASSSTNVTLPSGINDNDVAYMVVEANTATDRGDPSGWTLLDFTSSSTVLQQKVYRKVLTSADSGTNVSWTLTNAQKWSIGVAIVENDGGVDVQNTASASGTAQSTWGTSAITPTTDDDLILAFNSWRVNVTGTTSQTPPTGYLEVTDTSLNASASPTFGTAINQKEITGGASVQVGSTSDGAYDQSTTNRVILVLAIKPGVDTISKSASDTGTVSLSESVETTASFSTTDTGTIGSSETTSFATIPITTSDTGTITGTDVAAITASLSTTDTGAITGTDTVTSTNVSLSTTDTGTVVGTESVATFATLSTTDSGTISGSDVGTFATVAVTASDSSTISSSESVATRADYPGSDTGTIVGTDTSSISITGTITVSASDTGTLVLAESVATTAALSTTDTGAITGTDATVSISATLSTSDSSAISGSDVGTFATVAVSASDSSAITGTDTASVAATVSTTDTGAITGTDATVSINTTLSTTDTGTLVGTESVATTAARTTTDASAITGTDTAAITAALSTTDTGTISSTESVATTAARTTTDTGTISSTESTAFAVTLSTSDSGAITGTDTGTFATVAVTTTDTGTIVGTDTAAVRVDYPGSDTGTIVGTDTSSIQIGGTVDVSASDTGTVQLSESVATRASFSTTDSGAITGTDSANIFVNSTTDSGAIVGTDTSAITVLVSTTDTGTIVGSDSSSIVASGVSDITASDTGTLSSTESAQIAVSVTTTDTGQINSSESRSFGTVAVTATDTSNIGGADAGTFQSPITLSTTDTGTLVGTDTVVAVFNSLPGSDSGIISGSDVASVVITFSTKSASDSSAITSTESVATRAGVTTSDSSAISSTESVSTYVTLTTSDTGQIVGSDSGSFGQSPVTASDSGAIASTESATVVAGLTASDFGGINGSDASSLEILGIVSISASDTGLIQVSDVANVQQITQIDISATDTLAIMSADTSNLSEVTFGEVNVEGSTGLGISVAEGETANGINLDVNGSGPDTSIEGGTGGGVSVW